MWFHILFLSSFPRFLCLLLFGREVSMSVTCYIFHHFVQIFLACWCLHLLLHVSCLSFFWMLESFISKIFLFFFFLLSSQDMPRSSFNVELDAAHGTWLANDVAMLSTKTGELLSLTLFYDGRLVSFSILSHFGFPWWGNTGWGKLMFEEHVNPFLVHVAKHTTLGL